jgi:hypothetical protein
LRTRKPREFEQADPPAWVTDWLSRRSEKEEKKAEKKDKPVDEAAQAKRQQARQKKVADGLEELHRFIKDIVRNGMLNLPEKGSAFWENMAKRMVDAQAPGLAAQLRALGEISYFTEGWQTRCLDQLLKIYLVIQGYKNIDTLQPQLQQDIRTLIGFPQNQEELKAQPGISDNWFVLAKQTIEEEKLLVERNWLYGMNTRRYALILQFYVLSQPPAVSLPPGLLVDANLVFYDSMLPLRAIIKEQRNTKKASQLPEGFDNWTAVINRETTGNATYPFADAWPCIVNRVKPIPIQNEWWLQDERQQLMRINGKESTIWNLLAVSGGAPMHMSLIGKENEFEPLGVWFDNQYKML